MKRNFFVYIPLVVGLLFCVHGNAQLLGAGLVPPSKQKVLLSYMGSLQPEAKFGDESTKAGLEKGMVTASVPFAKTDQDSWTISTMANWIDISPDQSQRQDLYQFEMGLTYSRVIEDNRFWAVNGSVGSASDKPFKDPSVDTLGATYFYVNPTSPETSWLFLVNYSNNRPILNNIPLPGFAYTYIPSKTFRGTFGVPFAMIYWEFVDRWSVNLFTLIPWVIKTSVDYSVNGPMKASLGLDFSQGTYYIYGRENKNERLFYDEKRIYLGFKSPLNRQMMAEVETGYSFDRKFFSAENYEVRPNNALHLGSSPYLKIALQAGF
ncbi:MAG: DUF6268 family outer membrane beta-barrel protein [Bacillota bacterium]